MDWTDVLIVVRNEPSPSHDGRVRVVGRTRDGDEVILNEREHTIRPGTLIWLNAEEN